jgi:hypothetical protein
MNPLKSLASEYGRVDAPLGSYLGLIALFNVLLGGFLAVTAQRRRGAAPTLPEYIGVGDILLMGVATHKLSRLLAKDKVLSGVRAPFARYKETSNPSEVEESARGHGVQKAIGELLTCPYCVGLWVASFFNYGLVFNAPATRLVGSIFTTLAIADFLQPFYVEATETSEVSGVEGGDEHSGQEAGGDEESA